MAHCPNPGLSRPTCYVENCPIDAGARSRFGLHCGCDTMRIARGNVGTSHPMGNPTAETALAGWGERIRTSEWQKLRPSNCRVRSEGALPPRASCDTANFDLGILRRATLRIEVCAGDGAENQDQHDKDRARWQGVADQRQRVVAA